MDSDVIKIFAIFVAMGTAGSLTFAAVRLVSAYARRLEGRTGGGGELADQVEELRARVEEGEAVRTRLLELEERLDFAERLLTQERDRSRLPAVEDR